MVRTIGQGLLLDIEQKELKVLGLGLLRGITVFYRPTSNVFCHIAGSPVEALS